MSRVVALATRELGSLFRTPVGWIVIALYLFLTGLVFILNTLVPGETATLRYFFGASAMLLVPIAPAISMRLFAEEYRAGTIEVLGTTALSPWTLAFGKWLGAGVFLILMLLPTLIYPIILLSMSDPNPDPGPMLTGYLGLVLVGLLYLSIGELASSVTSSQTLAFLATLMFLILISLASTQLASLAPPPFDVALLGLSIDRRIRDFSIGVLDTTHLVFLITGIALFVSLTAGAVTMRRWR
jgi:ABC-2 type transport system permease protein